MCNKLSKFHIISALLIIITIPKQGISQIGLSNIYFSIQGGKSDYYGDWGQTITSFSKPFLQSGFGIGNYISTSNTIKLNLSHGIWGYQSLDTNSLKRGFRMIQLSLIKCRLKNAETFRMKPSLGFGMGVRMISGNYLTPNAEKNNTFNWNNMKAEIVFCFSIGLNFSIHPKINLFAEFQTNLTTSDHLDGRISKGINFNSVDYHLLPSIGLMFYPWTIKTCPNIVKKGF